MESLTKDQPKQRVCLRCPKTFLSTWSGHRICPRCHEYLAKVSYEQEYTLVVPNVIGGSW